MISWNEAITTKLVGSEKLTSSQKVEYELTYLKSILSKLKEAKNNGVPSVKFYIEYFPLAVIKAYLVNFKFANSQKAMCEIKDIWYKDANIKNSILVSCTGATFHVTSWTMYLSTVCGLALANKYKTSNVNIVDKWFKRVTLLNIDSFINELNAKISFYEQVYKEEEQKANSVIYNELNKYENKMIVSRQAVKRAICDIKRDITVVNTAFNSTLTAQEQKILVDYIKKNVYSMRLYVVQDSEWDQAITKIYPDSVFGEKRRTIPSEKSKNSITGYISLNDISGAPLDLIQKITHKEDKYASLIKNKGSNKYRLNNYLLVLFLLSNYNDIGFVTGKTHLSMSIR